MTGKAKGQPIDSMGNPIGSSNAKPAKKSSAKSKAAAAPTSSSSVADLTPHLPYTDLREWIAEAEKMGEVREVSGANLAGRHRHGDRAAFS